MIVDTPWMTEARRLIGQREVPGKPSNPVLAGMWNAYTAVWRALGADDSSAPWCGVFVAHCLRTAGLPTVTHAYRARAWLDYGSRIALPVYGCLAIFERTGGGHVAFVGGRDERGRLMCYGGNQGDAVSVAPFDSSRVLGYRYPPGVLVSLSPLPLLASNGAPLSTNEA